MKTAYGPERIKSLKNKYLPLVLFATAFLLSLSTSAQYDSTKTLQRNNAYGYEWGNIKVYPLGALIPPTDTIRLKVADSGALAVKNNRVWFWTGYAWQSATADISGITSGTGSPEDVVFATVGTIYRRTDGSTNSTIYIKESGTGSSGWVAIGAGGTTGGTTVYLGPLMTNQGTEFDNPANPDTTVLSTINYVDRNVARDSSGRVGDSIISYRNGTRISAVIDNVGAPGTGDGWGTDTLVKKAGGFIRGKGTPSDSSYLDTTALLPIIRSQIPGTTLPPFLSTATINVTGNAIAGFSWDCATCGVGAGNPRQAFSILDYGGKGDAIIPGSGSVPTSGTDNTPALNNMFSTLPDGSLIYIPGGGRKYWFKTVPDTLKNNKKFYFIADGDIYNINTSGAGIDFIIIKNESGAFEQSRFEFRGNCFGKINMPSHSKITHDNGTGPNWSTFTGTLVKIVNCFQQWVEVNKAEGYLQPVNIMSGYGEGSQENTVIIRWSYKNARSFTQQSIDGNSYNDKNDIRIYRASGGTGLYIDGYAPAAAINGEIHNGSFNSNKYRIMFEQVDTVAVVNGDVREPYFELTTEGGTTKSIFSGVAFKMRSVAPNYVRNPTYSGPGFYEASWLLNGMGLNAKGWQPIWDSPTGRLYGVEWKTDGSGNIIIVGSTLTATQRAAAFTTFFYAPGNTQVVYKSNTASTYTAAAGEVIKHNHASGTITAPSASANVGRRFTVQNIGSNAVTISGVTTYTSVPAGDNMTWESDGTGWYGVVNAEGAGGGSGQFVTDANGINSNGLRTGIGVISSTTTFLNVAASTTSQASLTINPGAHPTTPVNGDEWRFQGRRFTAYNSIVSEYLMVPNGGIAGDIPRRTADNSTYEHVQQNYERKEYRGVDVTVTSTASEASMLGSGDIVKEEIPIGSSYKCTVRGLVTVAADATDPNVKFQIGNFTQTVALDLPTGITSQPFTIVMDIQRRTSSTYWQCEISVANNSVYIVRRYEGTGAAFITTGVNLISNWQWLTSGNSITFRGGYWEIFRAQ